MTPGVAISVVWSNLTVDAGGVESQQGSIDKGCDDGVPELHDETDEPGEQEE